MRLLTLLLVAFLFVPPSNALDKDRQGDTTGDHHGPRNVILFVPDGFGPAQGTMARDYKRDYLGEGSALVIDGIEVGSIRTHSTDNRVTDSASSATAYATGVKTYNGAIGVDTERRPIGTVLQAAKRRGMATGVVTTTRITHATPASFVAHVPQRSMENEIAEHLLWTRPDVVIGGGTRFFVPDSEGGSRTDGRNLIEEARNLGYTVALDRSDFNAGSSMPFFALLADDHLAFEVDRHLTDEPSLADMTRKALELLSQHEDGFFVMIEAGRIDHAAHGNDIAGMLHDVLAFDEAMRVALEFVEEDGNTLLISVADHETGGMTLGRNIDGRSHYGWYPEVVARVKASHGPIVAALTAEGRDPVEVIDEFTTIDDLSDSEIEALRATINDGRGANGVLGEIIARRAVVGWTTGGHTAVDVRLHAAGVGSERLVGNHDNSFIGQIIAEMLNLDLEAVTKDIRSELAAQALAE
jgi:alkaline phosphatase